MKNRIFLIILILFISAGFISCIQDEELIKERIENMEDAINDYDLSSFLACFHDDCQYQDSYDQGQFDTLTTSGATTYDFHNYSISVSGSSADVDCTATVDDLNDYATIFEMKKDGDSWYIYVWTEDNVIMFQDLKFK